MEGGATVKFKNKKGQGIVEFACIVPIFILLLVGFLHMALVMHDYLAMGEATREIARHAAVGRTRDEIRNLVQFRNTDFYQIDEERDVQIQMRNDAQLGNFVEVTVTMRFDPSQGALLTEPFMPRQLTKTLTMRRE